MADIYITGAKGFIGKNLIKKLNKSDGFYRIRPVSHGLNMQEGEHIYSDYEDIKYLQNLVDYKNNNIIVNCAFYMPKRYLDIKPDKELYDKNKDIVDFLCEVFKGSNHVKIINVSSIDVYGCGEKELINIDENSSIHVEDFYSRSQKYQENTFRINFKDTINLRMSIVYGKGKDKETILEGFIKKAVNNKDIQLQGKGSNTRDYIYIEDVLRTIKHFIDIGARKGEVYNLTSGYDITTRKLVEDIIDIFNSKSKIETIDEEERPSVTIDNKKLKEETSIKFKTPKEGLKELKVYYEEKYKGLIWDLISNFL